MSPSSTPSPKKRQLPSIPLEAQMKSRDRGMLNVKLEPTLIVRTYRTAGSRMPCIHMLFQPICPAILFLFN